MCQPFDYRTCGKWKKKRFGERAVLNRRGRRVPVWQRVGGIDNQQSKVLVRQKIDKPKREIQGKTHMSTRRRGQANILEPSKGFRDPGHQGGG